MNSPSDQNPAAGPIIEPDFEATYTLEVVAQLSGVAPETVLFYREQGLIPVPAKTTAVGEQRFDDEALRTLRRLDHLRTEWELNARALKFTVSLLAEIERLRDAARWPR